MIFIIENSQLLNEFERNINDILIFEMKTKQKIFSLGFENWS
jgi:hypothetical protein